MRKKIEMFQYLSWLMMELRHFQETGDTTAATKIVFKTAKLQELFSLPKNVKDVMFLPFESSQERLIFLVTWKDKTPVQKVIVTPSFLFNYEVQIPEEESPTTLTVRKFMKEFLNQKVEI